MRDYAFNEIVGGTKGEKCDFLLLECADGSLRFIPVASKVKLNKKRRATMDSLNEEMGEGVAGSYAAKAAAKHPDHILIAPR